MDQSTLNDRWRQTHLGQLMTLALHRFDVRVLTLMSQDVGVPLALSHLAARGRLTASHVHITRHLELNGSRLTGLASKACMTKQAMGKLVDQCEAWGLVQRVSDRTDGRAKRIMFTDTGLIWLGAFQDAVVQAEAELASAVGQEIATVIALGLVYSQLFNLPVRQLMPYVCAGLVVWGFMNSVMLDAGTLFIFLRYRSRIAYWI